MEDLLARFCRYVQVETTAVEETDRYPSSPGQLELGRLLVKELEELGLEEVSHSQWGIVMATIPATVPEAPAIAWFAHLDTSPETTASGVKPQVVRHYPGGDIVLPGDERQVIRVADTPQLAELQGKTLITTDGTTLLGADDKAGVAVIMTAAARLVADEELPRGPIRVVFTCDEEVGRGTDHLDLDAIGAVAGYTLDGEDEGIIEAETFSADLAVVTVRGVNIHPGLAYQRMVNALRVAGDFLARLPRELAPETTRNREGFIHPYVVEGGVAEVRIRLLLRSFETGELNEQAELLRTLARAVRADHPGSDVDVAITEQYRNMKEFLGAEPRAVELAVEAMRWVGLEPAQHSIRGGTDGSRLSQLGLPTPNLSTGMHNFHSPLEFACLEQMERAVDVLIELAGLWAGQSSEDRDRP